MVVTLIESRHARTLRTGNVGLSAMLHTGLLLALAFGLPQTRKTVALLKPEQILLGQLVERKSSTPPPPKAAEPVPTRAGGRGSGGGGGGDVPAGVLVGPPPPKGFQVLAAPVNIPNVIPGIDLSRPVTNEEDFTGRGVAGGVARGVVGGTGPVTADVVVAPGKPVENAYFQFQVEKTVRSYPDNPAPIFPEPLRAAGLEGRVLIQYVVDTTGLVDLGSVRALESTHPLFSRAVAEVLAKYHFVPAEIGGRRVRMLVQQPFVFQLAQ